MVFQVIIINKKGEFYDYVYYTKNLEFTQDPDYAYLKNLFKSVMDKHKFKDDNIFDWNDPNDTFKIKCKKKYKIKPTTMQILEAVSINSI